MAKNAKRSDPLLTTEGRFMAFRQQALYEVRARFRLLYNAYCLDAVKVGKKAVKYRSWYNRIPDPVRRQLIWELWQELPEPTKCIYGWPDRVYDNRGVDIGGLPSNALWEPMQYQPRSTSGFPEK